MLERKIPLGSLNLFKVYVIYIESTSNIELQKQTTTTLCLISNFNLLSFLLLLPNRKPIKMINPFQKAPKRPVCILYVDRVDNFIYRFVIKE